MARWFLVCFLVAFLLCVVQAFPQTATQATSPTNTSQIESAVNDALESLQKGWKELTEDPGLNKLLQDGQKLIESAAESIKNKAAEIVPKTD